ncbi:CoA transferase [Roseomonas sp. PWR1]|uniref:CoA transferase n=1 Tax=Roseomonas nitratireducens TaxID=2820810 RepID=A0ABS4ANH1_9PROT|nr:CoA transferase [Neoroseomonas nitratireducens]MBP0462386.1 CoA transferase [Neoroseomonas nitratireducens]
MLPLQGVRVIEVGQALAGPLAGAIMADMGADVIKVEKPDGGDDARGWGPPFGPDGVTSLYFHGQNRNKRGITLDLKKAEDVEALHRLCETADILVQNLRPGVVEEIGIGPAAMLARHPRLIYCSIWAFGDRGPMRMKPGFDPLLQAYGGMMSVTGRPEDPPTFCGASINDKATGMFTVIGALGMLRRRDITGRGGLVDTSLFETAVHWVEGQVNNHLHTGDVPKRHGTGGAVIVPYQVFDTADRPLCLAAGNDRLWARCAAVLGHAEWAGDERFAKGAARVRNKAVLLPLIAEVLRTRPRDEWIAALEGAGVPCAPVNDIGEVVASPQFDAVGIVQQLPGGGPRVVGLPISFDGERPRSLRDAPRLGEHDAEVLGRARG